MSNFISLETFLENVQRRDPSQPEFLRAVREVFSTLWPFLEKNPQYRDQNLLARFVEPERVIQFRVTWVDDQGQVQVNRAWRAVQLRYRPVQRRYALPSVRKPLHPQFPRL